MPVLAPGSAIAKPAIDLRSWFFASWSQSTAPDAPGLRSALPPLQPSCCPSWFISRLPWPRPVSVAGAFLAIVSLMSAAGCATQAQSGGAIGAFVGAVGGAATGIATAGRQADNRRQAALVGGTAGAVAGAAVGATIGARLDRADRERADAAARQAIAQRETGQAGAGVDWQGTDRGRAEAVGAVSVSGRQGCEQVKEVAIIRGEEVRQAAVFCRDPASGQLTRV